MNVAHFLAGFLSADGVADVQEDLEKLADTPNVIQKFISENSSRAINLGLNVVIAIVLFFIGCLLIKYVRKILNKALTKCNAEQGIITFLDSLVKIFLYFLLVVGIAARFGLKTSSVVALVGSVGLAMGLALQGSLANFAGGVLILLIRPFRVGDYIIAAGGEGTVKEITIVYTKLTTSDNKLIVIPNGMLSNSSLTNVSHMGERMLQLNVGVAYDSDLEQVKKVLLDVLQKEESRLQQKDAEVYVEELAAGAVKLGCRVWVKADAFGAAKCRINENVKHALDNAGIKLA